MLTVYKLTVATPSVVFNNFTFPRISCLGIGWTAARDRNLLYFGASNTLYSMEFNFTDVRSLGQWVGPRDCRYLTQQTHQVFFSAGTSYYWYNVTSAVRNITQVTTDQPVGAGVATGAFSSVESSNQFLFAVNTYNATINVSQSTIFYNDLDALSNRTGTAPFPATWTISGRNNLAVTTTHSIITINGVVVQATDNGIILYFGPFSRTRTNQTISRVILANISTIRGMATDSAFALAVSWGLALVAVAAFVL